MLKANAKTLILLIIVVLLVAALAAGIFGANDPSYPPKEGDTIFPSDYSDENNWLMITENPDLPVDVFVLYPTTYSPEGEEKISTIEDPGMRKGAKAFLQEKASALFGVGNFYAPYYRQLNATFLLTLPLEEQSSYIKGVPKTDAIFAFDYYIKNYNEGRPFILFSHSQGSSMNKEILFDYLKENPEVAKRMIASYVIGYSVTKEELAANPHLKFANTSDDVGVIISYNTEMPDFTGNNPVWLEGSVAINPITWTRSDAYASAEENLGSNVSVDGKYMTIEHLADARVDVSRGVVVCALVDPEIYSMPESFRRVFPYGCYHGYDIGFYYYNLRENAEKRVAKYFELENF